MRQIIAAIFTLAAIAQAHLCLFVRTLQPAVVDIAPEQSFEWNPELFKALTFGQLPAAIDWMWVMVLMDDTIMHVAPDVHPPTFYQLKLVTDLDPAFFEAYVAGASLLAVVRRDGVGAKDLLKKGENFRRVRLPEFGEKFQKRFWPAPWQIPMFLAYTELFELSNLPAAAEAFRQAERQSGVPEYVHHLVQRLDKPGGQFEVGIGLLDFMMKSSKEPKVIEELKIKKASLYLGLYLNQAQTEFLAFAGHQQPSPGLWDAFIARNPKWSRDPFNGELSFDVSGKVVSSTPHQKVFGLQ